MKKQRILIVSETERENPGMVNSLRSEPDWDVSPVSSAEEAITTFYGKPFDIIIIGREINSTDEQKLRTVLSHCSFESIILKQKSINHDLLKEEIRELLIKEKINRLQNIRVTDPFNPVNQADKIRVIPFIK
ncbi:MAG: hypothetical protein ACRDE2_11215 [Chitinophagaceae bacterium]